MESSLSLEGMFRQTDDARDFAAGATVFTEGDHGDVMYVVLDGRLELHVGGSLLETVGAGDIIGEMALIDSGIRSATVTAKTGCRLAPVDQKRFLFLVQQTPYFSLQVMRVLADRLRRMNARTATPPAP